MNTLDLNVNKDENKTFIVEQDSLDICYRFFGQNVRISIQVDNKSSHPIYISWKESGIILDNAQSNNKKRINISAARDKKGTIDFGRFQDDPDVLTLVKEHSKVEKQILELSNFNFHKIKKSSFVTNYIDEKANGKEKTYKAIDYTDEDSPIQLKIYLTIYSDVSKKSEPIFSQTTFFQSKLIRGGKDDPYKMGEFKTKKDDFFYVKKENGRNAKKASIGTLKVLGVSTLWAINEYLKLKEDDLP